MAGFRRAPTWPRLPKQRCLRAPPLAAYHEVVAAPQNSAFVPIAPELVEIANDVLAYDPAVRLIVGPQAIRTLTKIHAGRPITGDELLLLREAMWSAAERGSKLAKKLTAKQKKQLVHLVEAADQISSYVILISLPPAQLDVILRRRRNNPTKTTTVTLEPADEDSRILILRVASLYQPIFQWEPRVQATPIKETVQMVVSGEAELVDPLVQTIFETLGVNAYRGIWTADRRRVFNSSRSANGLRRRLMR